MHPDPTTNGFERQLLARITEIVRLSAPEPGTMDEANEMLWSIRDAAGQAYPDSQD